MFKVWTRNGFIEFYQPNSFELICSEYMKKPRHFVNAYSLTLADEFAHYHSTLSNGVVYCDSRIVSLYSRMVGSAVAQLRGVDFMRGGLSKFREVPQVVISGLPYTSNELSAILSHELGEEIHVSNFLPPFTSEIQVLVNTTMDFLHSENPTVVWVAIGTPKQDILASKLSSEFKANYFCIGAAVNFLTNRVNECPKWISRIGLEWLFRFTQEPSRLWRRYLVGNFQFLKLIGRDFQNRRNYPEKYLQPESQ